MRALRIWVILTALLWWWEMANGQEVKQLQSQTGIYFDEAGTISFYPMRWKVVSYINLEPIKELWKSTKEHHRKVAEYCNKVSEANWYYLTDCGAFQQYMRSKTYYIDNLRDLVSEYMVGSKNVESFNKRAVRTKRGVLNLVGEIAKVLFGTLTQSDAEEYNKHISELEKEQSEFLHLSKDQMTVIKSTLSSVNLTIQRVNQNEKTLKQNLNKLANYTDNKVNALEVEIENISQINEQIRILQRGIEECQHSFEILLDAFVHAEQGTLQPQLITTAKIKKVMESQALPNGLDYPPFPLPELQKIMIPHVYALKQYLVYVLEIPLLSPNIYHLYKILPFPVSKGTNTYVFLSSSKEFIFSDSMRQHYGKMSNDELSKCFQTSMLNYVCKEDVPIYTSIPGMDCEASLLHPSTTIMPHNCETRIIRLERTFWIPLFLNNQWLFVTPRQERLTVLCGDTSDHITIQKEGKLCLNQRCKAFSTYVTLFATSTLESNFTNDFLPIVPINYDCCFDSDKVKTFADLELDIPLVNIMSSVDDLKIASVKVDEVEKLIEEQGRKNYTYWYANVITGSSVFGIFIVVTFSCCVCFCCVKKCRNCTYWLWDRCSPKNCWKETRERFCINIHNYSGAGRIVSYQTTGTRDEQSSTAEINSTISPAHSSKFVTEVDGEKHLSISTRTRSSSKAFR